MNHPAVWPVLLQVAANATFSLDRISSPHPSTAMSLIKNNKN